MKLSAKQIIVAFVSLILTLGALLAGQRVYHATVVEKPLTAQLGSISGVQEASLNGSTLIIALKPTSNLMTVYESVLTSATADLGHAPANVVIKGQANSTLKKLAQNLSFVVAQGEATGQFVAMQKNIEAMAAQVGASAAVELDTHNIYLTLRDHQHVLYDVIPVTIGGGGHA